MKRMVKKITLGMLTAFLLVSMSQAQDIDTKRMNRDIRIMENILDELFKINTSTGSLGGQVRVLSTSMGLSEVEGTYLPNYGIIFKIPQLIDRRISSVSVNSNNGNSQVSFYYDSDDDNNSDAITEESVIARITEFLTDYASTIGQLEDDQNVMVLYGPKSGNDPIFAIYSMRGDLIDKDESKPLPVISVVAKKSDLDALRNGRINESTFKDRLNISTSKDKEYLDLKVMSNIFETALKEVPSKSFRLSGQVNYLMLENFGALFSLDARYNHHNTAEVFFLQERSRRGYSYSTTQSKAEASQNQDEDEEEEMQENLAEAYERLKRDITEYLVDYGRTLSSVKSNQNILTSVSISESWIDNDLPDRVDFQISKSVLERFDRGNITREEALNSVTVTEY